MNRRSFISGILKAAIGAQIIIPKAIDAFRWKRVNELWIVNPEWIDAPYEVAFMKGHQFESQLFKFIPSFQDFIMRDTNSIKMNRDNKIVPMVIKA